MDAWLHRLQNRLVARLYGWRPSLASQWAQRLSPMTNGAPIPWAEPRKPLREATLALVTTGGVHLKLQRAFDMADPNGDPTFREIPVDVSRSAFTITHDYYDHHDAEKDLNLVLPTQRLRDLVEHGALGYLHPTAFSFMGHIDGPHLETLTTVTAPDAAERLREAKVDYALLVPA